MEFKTGLYPKFELFDEYRQFTEGKSIGIISFAEFLELFGAKEKVIQDIKENYPHPSIPQENNGGSNYDWIDVEIGDFVRHEKFGLGEVLRTDGEGIKKKAIIKFSKYGARTLWLKYAKLMKEE